MPVGPGDAARGAELYVKQCEHCHTIEKGAPHVFGPNLWSIFGQRSGEIPGSKPSQAYKDMNVTWTPGTMFEYLADTSKTRFPGSKKPYKGLPSEQDRNDIIAYLETKKDKKWFGIW
ncbi:hypothetical protein BX600DRAFT_474745 [Xylariales sp. PMI_506]|nr:hypothetical protein BX600DRAFT_474745 [Xylariales sp. PMI_506]